MHGVTAVVGAELFDLKPTRCQLLVPRRGIVTTLTLCAGQCNNISRHDLALFLAVAHEVMHLQNKCTPHSSEAYSIT